jgi:hypothetical protein
VAGEVPFGIGVVDADKSRPPGWGGIRVSIVGVGFEDEHEHAGAESEEEFHTGLFDAGRVGVRDGVKFGRGASGSIAAVARFALSGVGLVGVGPMLAENDSTGRGDGEWRAIHSLFGHSVELFEFGFPP